MLTTTEAPVAALARAASDTRQLDAPVTPDQPDVAVLPAARPYAATVSRIERLTPTFLRITFTGPQLHLFGTDGLDQRIKVMLPLPGIGFTPLDENDWWGAWRRLPNELRNPLRTYTVRAVRSDRGEVDIDFVAHGDTGPASRWATSAAVGDELILIGPCLRTDGLLSGVEWKPGDATHVLLAGDETAAPAICSIISAMPRDAKGCAFIEVPTIDDALPIDAPNGVHVTWLARNGDAHGSALDPAVRAWTDSFVSDGHRGERLADVDIENGILWEVPEPTSHSGGLYAWLAGEAGVIKTLRRFLVSETGLDRHQVAFMGYWRVGRAES
ncbi:NADPH-dependent ferric siderophore reductase [Okibacterium sp. HSC-33S16]|uniref:siderophore-interacting protein n=1 Tax=Okibacterium sp. HSC-33S16 TaxID=2910965 RepID=UPI00209DDE46|nr:siderophore-interacting protein [Okibacterium sp. HSC-33S16]MCP2032082.1 NADPH-dependent ferric siderophore reductase [Okibacterium sp. HSC-33S16]